MTQATPFPRHVESANAFQKVGFSMLLMYLFVMYSRLFDVVLSSFEIPFIITSLVLAASLFSGGFQRSFQSPVGKVLFMFTMWMGICVPFSIWKGGSFPFFEFYLKAAISFVYVAGLIDSHRQIVRSIYAIAFAGTAFDDCAAGNGAGALSGSGPEGGIGGTFTFYRVGVHLYISGNFVSGGEPHTLQYWLDILPQGITSACDYSTAQLIGHGVIADFGADAARAL